MVHGGLRYVMVHHCNTDTEMELVAVNKYELKCYNYKEEALTFIYTSV